LHTYIGQNREYPPSWVMAMALGGEVIVLLLPIDLHVDFFIVHVHVFKKKNLFQSR
jgi:hypothetical protein